MSTPRLDWKSAEVHDAVLRVTLEGDRPKGWKASFETTVRLLGGGDWGQVKLKSATIRVADVGPGTEDKLRHFLESVREPTPAGDLRPRVSPRGPGAQAPAGGRRAAAGVS